MMQNRGIAKPVHTNYHYIFDLDDTLIKSVKVIRPYLKTAEGREFIVDNIMSINTRLISKDLVKIVRNLCKVHKISVVTNSPGEYAKAVLKKHGFPGNIQIYGSASKPDTSKLYEAITYSGVPLQRTLLIGDSALDIITAHEAHIASVGVQWGDVSSYKQLIKAEPQLIIKVPETLEDAISEFENKKFQYAERELPGNYLFLAKKEYSNQVDMELLKLGDYYPPRIKKDSFSNMIFRYKESKDYSYKEISEGIREKYFYGGTIRDGPSYKEILKWFFREVKNKIKEIDGYEEGVLIAAPNSLPEFCYKFDVNQVFVKELKEHHQLIGPGERIIKRVYPKVRFNKDIIVQFQTIGVHYKNIASIEELRGNVDKNTPIIIFDDIKTTATQAQSIAVILRYFGLDGKFYCLTLGETCS